MWADAALAPRDWDFKTLGELPVQSAGRVKPFDSYAWELVTAVVGKKRLDHLVVPGDGFPSGSSVDPKNVMLSWIVHPDIWNARSFIWIPTPLAKRLELPLQPFYSPELLLSAPLLLEASHQFTGLPGVAKVQEKDQDIKQLVDRVQLFQAVVTGRAWPIIPVDSVWQTVADVQEKPSPIVFEFWMLLKKYAAAGPSSSESDKEAFAVAAQRLVAAAAFYVPDWQHQQKLLHAEVFLNHLRPFFFAWVFYFVAGFLFVVSYSGFGSGFRFGNFAERLGWLGLMVGIVWHLTGMGLRCYVARRPPVTNMYESVVWVALGCAVFAFIMLGKKTHKLLATVCSILAGGFLVFADNSPNVLDATIKPLVPVLRSNSWLTIHVLTITLSYAAFAVSFGLSCVALGSRIWQPGQVKGTQGRTLLLRVNQMTYRALQIGVVLIAAGTILGGVWADYSWGRFWGWDPKEVWALITLLAYTVVIHGRYTQWMNPVRFALATNICFGCVLMAWLGVNFVLGAGLHSYGFSTGGGSFLLLFALMHSGLLALWAGTMALQNRSPGQSYGQLLGDKLWHPLWKKVSPRSSKCVTSVVDGS